MAPLSRAFLMLLLKPNLIKIRGGIGKEKEPASWRLGAGGTRGGSLTQADWEHLEVFCFPADAALGERTWHLRAAPLPEN